MCVHEVEECGGAARFGTRPFARGSGDGHQRVRRGKCPFSYHGARAEKSEFNIKLQRDFDTSVGAVDLQPHEITRDILNLLSNGFYAASKRKSDAVDDAFEPVLRAMTRNLGEAVEIRISDNGTGMPPELKEKMFNPFFTTKPAGDWSLDDSRHHCHVWTAPRGSRCF